VAVPASEPAALISELPQEAASAEPVEAAQDVSVEPPAQSGSRGRRRKSA